MTLCLIIGNQDCKDCNKIRKLLNKVIILQMLTWQILIGEILHDIMSHEQLGYLGYPEYWDFWGICSSGEQSNISKNSQYRIRSGRCESWSHCRLHKSPKSRVIDNGENCWLCKWITSIMPLGRKQAFVSPNHLQKDLEMGKISWHDYSWMLALLGCQSIKLSIRAIYKLATSGNNEIRIGMRSTELSLITITSKSQGLLLCLLYEWQKDKCKRCY